MSRKRRQERQEREAAAKRRFWRNAILVVSVIAALLLMANWPQSPQRATPEVKKQTQELPQEDYTTYLELENLPEDDKQAKSLIRKEYYNFEGYTFYGSEREIPLRELLVPDEVFQQEELQIIAQCVNIIGAVMGVEDPVFLALKDWAERKEGRIITEIVPLGKKVGIRNNNFQFGFDAFWSPDMKMLYMGRHQLPYFNLFLSTLYQEAFHAIQLGHEKVDIARHAEIELEAHQAQLLFNQKMIDFHQNTQSPSRRRYLLEIEVINESLKESIEFYKANLIKRQGIPIKQ